MKEFAIFFSIVAVGVWYIHSRPALEETSVTGTGTGEIVVAKAPGGWIDGRWQSPNPAPTDAQTTSLR